MPVKKSTVVAQLSDKELELLKNAQEKYITDGKGNASIRTVLMLGVYSLIGLDIKKDS